MEGTIMWEMGRSRDIWNVVIELFYWQNEVLKLEWCLMRTIYRKYMFFDNETCQQVDLRQIVDYKVKVRQQSSYYQNKNHNKINTYSQASFHQTKQIPMPTPSPYVQYLNKLINSPSQLTAIQQLSDGLYMHQIISGLKQFQLSYPYQIIPQPLTFIHRMKNIKSLIKAIHQFWSNHVGQDLCYEIDAIKIAKDHSPKEIQKLIRLLVKTLFQARDKHYFIEKVLETSQDTQEFFMDLVKQQTSIQFTSPKSCKSNKNYNDSLYDKLLELEHQNEHLMKLVEELASQSHQHTQRQKEFQQKMSEKQTEIRRLNWALNQMNEKKFKPEDGDLSVSRERFMDEMVNEKVKEIQERERLVVADLQKCKYRLKSQSEDLKKLQVKQSQFQILQQQNVLLKQQNTQLSQQITSLKHTISALESRITSLQSQSSNTSNQLTIHKSKLSTLQQQLNLKSQQIQHLQTHIRFLTQEKEQSLFRHNGSSIKQDCRQMGQPVIVRKKRQTDKVNKELRSALLTVTKQEKQLEKLRLIQEENKKLVQMISHMHKYRGEENEVLVNCLYKMRVKLLQKENTQKYYENIKQNRSPLGEISLNE